MHNRINSYIMIFATAVFSMVACKEDDDNKIEKFTSNIDVTNADFRDDKYSMTFLFSTDDGKTWVDYPVLKPGTAYSVKVLNSHTGEVVPAENYDFDWSKSNPAPTSGANADVAKFTASKVNDIKVSVARHLCTYNPSSWVGAWKGDEDGTCCSGTDANNIRQDPSNPNKFIMDNFWGDGVDAYFILTPSSTSYWDQVLTMPKQTTSEGGIAEGTGMYDQCDNTFVIDTKYTFPGLTDTNVQALTVSATSDARVYAATPSGIFYSGDSGGTFTLRTTATTGTTVVQLAASGNNVFAATPAGVYYSSDRAVTMALKNTGLTNTNVKAVVISGTNVLAGTDGGGVFLTVNNGTSWAPVNTGLTNLNVVAMAAAGSDIYVATKGGLFYSNTAGATWTPIATSISNTFTSLAATGSKVWAGTSSGLFYSNDKGVTWKSVVNSGLTTANITLVAAGGTDAYVATADGAVFKSSDSGATWTAVTGLSGTPVALVVAPTLTSKLYAASADKGGYKTENGKSFTSLTAGTTYAFDYIFYK